MKIVHKHPRWPLVITGAQDSPSVLGLTITDGSKREAGYLLPPAIRFQDACFNFEAREGARAINDFRNEVPS